MKKLFTGVLTVLFILGAVSLAMAEKGTMELKVGDEVYACNCGEKCPCNTMSRNPGNCTCGSPMVKAKVLKVEPGTAEIKADSWDKPRVFKRWASTPAIADRIANATPSARTPASAPAAPT